MRGYLPPGLAKAASVLPLLPLELVARRLLANAMAARPTFASRLGEHAGRTFAIDPVDCPFVFLFTPQEGRASLRVARGLSDAAYDARIAAPLVVLLAAHFLVVVALDWNIVYLRLAAVIAPLIFGIMPPAITPRRISSCPSSRDRSTPG